MPPRTLVLALAAAGTLVACRREGPGAALRLGYFPNVTHAQALVGLGRGAFSAALGGRFSSRAFNAGPGAMEALLAGDLDVSYVGPGPAVNAYLRSRGEALRVVAGAISGGAGLVVRTAQSPQDLRGKTLASPQLGNTQDIALRLWLSRSGLAIDAPGGVAVRPLANPDILALFARGDLEGAWVPEPWGARLVAAGGHVLVDERNLWEGGRFPTTIVVASTRALRDRRDQVVALLRIHLALTEIGRSDPRGFAREVNQQYGSITGQPLSDAVLRDAFSRIELTADPMPAQLAEEARRAQELNFAPKGDVSSMVDPAPLREAMRPPARAEGGARPGAGTDAGGAH
jgi:NitT/TauT family transport system substrate-binding protein